MLKRSTKTTKIQQNQISLSNEELTTYNIILTALKNQEYKDSLRQIQHFTKISKHQITVIFQSIVPLINLNVSLQIQLQQATQSKNGIVSILAQIDKLVRNQKFEELEKLKNKTKNQAPIEIIQIIQDAINLNIEIKKFRKKDSILADRQMRSAQKEKLKRNLQAQNAQLVIALKNMELKINDLQAQKTRLEQNVKRLQRPSLPPRRPSTQKQSQSLKKSQEKQLKTQIQLLSKENQQQKILIESLKQEKMSINTNQHKEIEENLRQQISQYQNTLGQYQSKLISTQEKLYNYKSLFENINNKITSQNQPFTLQQSYQTDQGFSPQKIIELKHSFETSQLQIRKIENQVERIIQQRQIIIKQKEQMQLKMTQTIQMKEQQKQNLQILLKQQQSILMILQQQILQTKKQSDSNRLQHQQQKNFMNQHIHNAQDEIIRNKNRYESQLQQYKKKCERYTSQISQNKQELQQIHKKVTLTTPLPQDHQKQQLRKQLQLINHQLTNLLRNNQQQKRQHRKYIEEIINQSEMQSTIYNEQKRILKESIERARNQEYQINQQKIRKQREDIQTLRAENQRLTSIIDSNQASFNQLIKDHEDIGTEMQRVAQENRSLTQKIQQSEREKQELIQRLQKLQEKLTDFQGKIQKAIKQDNYAKNQKKLNTFLQQNLALSEQKQILSKQISDQARQLVQIHQQLIKLQAELNYYRQIQQQSKKDKGQYTRYLQEKLQEAQSQIKRQVEIEAELSMKIQNLIKNNNQIQTQKQLTQSKSQNLLVHHKIDNQKEIAKMQEKINKLQGIINEQNNKELKQCGHSQEIIQMQLKLTQSQSNKQKVLLQNNKLKIILEKYNKEHSYFEQQMEENKKLALQNKRLLNKAQMLSNQFQQLKQKYFQTQKQILILQKIIQQNNQNKEPSFQNKGFSSQSLQVEILWFKEQLRIKQIQINQLRGKQFNLPNFNEAQIQKQKIQEKYRKQSIILEQIKSRVTILQQMLNGQNTRNRNLESLISQKNQQINSLQAQLRYQRNEIFQLQKRNEQNKYQNSFLLQIAQQLDQNYQIDSQSQSQIQIRILQKISNEISLLIATNSHLISKCQLLQRQRNKTQANLLASLQYMVSEFLSYLSSQKFINPEHIPPIPRQTNCEKLIMEIGLLLRDIFYDSIRYNINDQ